MKATINEYTFKVREGYEEALNEIEDSVLSDYAYPRLFYTNQTIRIFLKNGKPVIYNNLYYLVIKSMPEIDDYLSFISPLEYCLMKDW